MSGFEQLERQLRATIADRNPSTAPRKAPGRFRRRRPLVVIIAALVLSGSGAVAVATTIHSPASIAKQAREIGTRAVSLSYSRHVAACEPAGLPQKLPPLRLTDAPILPGIVDRIPVLAHRSPPAELDKALALMRRFDIDRDGVGPVIASSVHFIPTSATQVTYVFVRIGGTLFKLRDPAACEATRVKFATELTRHRDPEVLDAAKVRLAARFEVFRGEQQTLTMGSMPRDLIDHPDHRFGDGFGSESGTYGRDAPFPHDEVPYGLHLSGGNGYLGLASPRATRILVRATRPVAGISVPESVPVVDGFWNLTLPSGTGRIRLTEVAADGSVLRAFDIRGACGGCAGLR